MNAGCLLRGLLLLVLTVGGALAQARDERTAGVGARARIEQIVLPGTELVAAPTTMKSPIAVRVLKVWPHGQLLRYDLEWTGLDAGTHDLAKYLARKDGSATTDLPALPVTVTTVLGKGMVEPSEPAPQPAERLDGYTRMQWIAGIAWAVGLLVILFAGRRFRRKPVAAVAVPTLADRLRPLVQSVVAGGADTAAKAELERLLLAFWRSRLALQQATAVEAIVAIHRHPEAGALLRQLERWLHEPVPPTEADWNALLAPYRAVTAAEFAPLAEGKR